MAQLSSCHSWDSQDSKKSCFFIYSIYWYKDSSLRDIVNVTSGLRWPWCGNLSRHGNRGHMTCKSFFVFSWGYHTNVATTLGPLWSSNEERRTHAHTLRHATAHTSRWRITDPWQATLSNVRFPHDSPVNYWTELFLLIHTLVCTQWISYLSNTPVHTHTWLQAFSLHVPETWADGTLRGAPQFISCCLEQWSLNIFVSFTVKTEEARSHYWNA